MTIMMKGLVQNVQLIELLYILTLLHAKKFAYFFKPYSTFHKLWYDLTICYLTISSYQHKGRLLLEDKKHYLLFCF